MRKLTGDLTNTIYCYNPISHAFALTLELFAEVGVVSGEEKEYSAKTKNCIRHRNKLEFAKITYADHVDQYLTIAIRGLKRYKKTSRMYTGYKGTVEECLTVCAETEAHVRKCVKVFLSSKVLLKELTVPAFLAKMHAIESSVSSISYKQAGRSDHARALKSIKALRGEVEDLIVDKAE